jgi:DNA-binding MarR family transcriptional regulator
VEETQRPGYEEGTGFLLSRLGTLAERSWASLLSRHGVTQTQYSALVVLGQLGPLGQGRLAELITVDPRNIVSIVDGLVSDDLAERRMDPSDGRRRQIHLTAHGRRVGREIAVDASSTQSEFLDPLDEDERAALNRTLRRLYHGLVGDGA